jgi:hypothetical protein
MPVINQASYVAIQPELTPGESVLWAGQPSPRIRFHQQDLLLIPFSLIWGGFAIFWEAGVAGFWGSPGTRSRGPWLLGLVWGIPFVAIGQYLIWGRFLHAAWEKKRTHYAVTNRRLIAVRRGSNRQMAACYLDTLLTLSKEGRSNGIGTLRFAQIPGANGRSTWASWDGLSVPSFVDIDDVDSVYRLVSDLREKTRAAKAGA